MQKQTVKQNFFIGLSLSNSSNYDSSICVMDRYKKIILIDKFYFASDIDYFFKTSPYVMNSIVCATVAYDNKLLDGKWRIHSKNYQVLSDKFKINRNNWTNRILDRCKDTFLYLKQNNIEVFRADINQLRMAYGLTAHFQSRTSMDCKNLQISLKLKFGFDEISDNMLPASSLEAIICSLFAMDVANKIKTSKIFEINEIPVLTRNVYD